MPQQKLDSRGPVLFKQRRNGFNQKEFCIYKFRTMMVQSLHATFKQTQRNDTRLTRLGKLLRRWNIDELPQLLNVLWGDMSLVGPRPHALAHDDIFYAELVTYARRHNVKPGITGLAQAMGFRGATETRKQMEDRVKQDLIYLQTGLFFAGYENAYLNGYGSHDRTRLNQPETIPQISDASFGANFENHLTKRKSWV